MLEIRLTSVERLICPHSARVLDWLLEKKKETGCVDIFIESNCVVIEYTPSYLLVNIKRVKEECSCGSCNCLWMEETLEEKSEEIYRRIEVGRYHLSYPQKGVLVVRL